VVHRSRSPPITAHVAIPYFALKYGVHTEMLVVHRSRSPPITAHVAILYFALKYGVQCTGTEMLAVPA
jgi:hypothetical protein